MKHAVDDGQMIITPKKTKTKGHDPIPLRILSAASSPSESRSVHGPSDASPIDVAKPWSISFGSEAVPPATRAVKATLQCRWLTSIPSTRQARRISANGRTVTITPRARAGSARASSCGAMTLRAPAAINSASAARPRVPSATQVELGKVGCRSNFIAQRESRVGQRLTVDGGRLRSMPCRGRMFTREEQARGNARSAELARLHPRRRDPAFTAAATRATLNAWPIPNAEPRTSRDWPRRERSPPHRAPDHSHDQVQEDAAAFILAHNLLARSAQRGHVVGSASS